MAIVSAIPIPPFFSKIASLSLPPLLLSKILSHPLTLKPNVLPLKMGMIWTNPKSIDQTEAEIKTPASYIRYKRRKK